MWQRLSILFFLGWLLLVGRGEAQALNNIYSFGTLGNDQSGSTAALVQCANGNLYGTTPSGGTASKGCVFAISPQGTYAIIHSFGDGSVPNDGATPGAELVQARDGNFYGMTQFGGGSRNKGTVFKMTPSGIVTILHQFGDPTVLNDGAAPVAGLIEGPDENLYGTTPGGGTSSLGTAFKITPGGVITILHSFGGTVQNLSGTSVDDGRSPSADLTSGADGKFYGTTNSGGYEDAGCVFSMTADGTVTLVHGFGQQAQDLNGDGINDGLYPTSGLIQASDGNFYGTTTQGGASGNGAFFRMNAQGFVTIMHSFDDGGNPASGVLLGPDGNFYGTTKLGGFGGNGTVYSCTPQGVFNLIYSFNDGGVATDGATPSGSLVLGSDGKLYGTTSVAGTNSLGTIFSIDLKGIDITNVTNVVGSFGIPFKYQINATNNPASYQATDLPLGLVIDSSTGLIDGTPAAMGAYAVPVLVSNSYGATKVTLSLFIVNTPAPTITSLLYAYGAIGQNLTYTTVATNLPTTGPPATFSAPGLSEIGLTIDSTTGIISGQPTKTGNFPIPVSVTDEGGTAQITLSITIFATPPTLSDEYVILHFVDDPGFSEGSGPQGITQAFDGNFYYTTPHGGFTNAGTIVRLTPQGVVTVLHQFQDGTVPNDAANPYGTLLQASDGNLYGTAYSGGSADMGTLFKISLQGTLTILHSFQDGSVAYDGGGPVAGLLQGSDGNFYGTTISGGSANIGTIFKMTPQGTVTILHSFGDGSELNPDGTVVTAGASTPEASLVQGKDGNFYGTTVLGGTAALGTIFRVTPGGVATILHNFGDNSLANDGAKPVAPLLQAVDGTFYGTTTAGGGSVGTGTVFSMTPQGVVKIIHSFTSTGTDGSYPTTPVIQGADGNLYGTTTAGGSTSSGTAFEITLPPTTTNPVFATAYNFGTSHFGTDGTYPGGLVQGRDGNIYGVTSAGGADGDGSVFVFLNLLTPSIPPTLIGSTTVQAGLHKPVAFTAQASQSINGGGGTAGSIVKTAMVQPSLISQALSFFMPAVSPAGTDSTTSWILSGDQTPILPNYVTFDSTSGSVSGTPTAGVGTYTFTITPQNSFGVGTESTITMYVEGTPTIANNVTAPATEGVPFSYSVEVSDNSYQVDYGATNLPGWLQIDTTVGLLGGVPPGPGVYVFNPIANNLAGSSGLQVTITVAPASPSAPRITSATMRQAFVGTPFSYQIVAGNSPFFYSALNLPPGLKINYQTGLISGTPTTAGSFMPSISATNTTTTYSSVLNLIVASSAPPTLASTLTVEAAQGLAFWYQIPASGLVGNYTTSAMLPDGLSLNPLTGIISGTPTTLGPFSTTITATNSNGNATSTLNLTVAAPTNYTAWAAHYAVTGGATGTPKGDAIPNYLKYLYDINPSRTMTASDRAALPTVGATTQGETQYLTLTYRKYALAGIGPAIQTSTDLQTWSVPTVYTLLQTDTDPSTGDPIMQAQVPVTNARQFIRLNVTPP